MARGTSDGSRGKRAASQNDLARYWIVNPLDETIALLALRGDAYVEQGVLRRGERAASLILDGFSVSVD